MLHNEVLSVLKHERPERAQNGKRRKLECRATPIHIVASADPKLPSIGLSRRGVMTGICKSHRPSEHLEHLSHIEPALPEVGPSILKRKGYSSDTLHDMAEGGDEFEAPRVIISLALEEHQTLNSETCQKWLASCPALIKYAKVEGVYKSFSTLVLLSLPVFIWDCLPEQPGCSFVAYVTSSNMMNPRDLSSGKRSSPRASRPTDITSLIDKVDGASRAYIRNFPDPHNSVKALACRLHDLGLLLKNIKNSQTPLKLMSFDYAALDRILSRCVKLFEVDMSEVVSHNKGENIAIKLFHTKQAAYQEEEMMQLKDHILLHHEKLAREVNLKAPSIPISTKPQSCQGQGWNSLNSVTTCEAEESLERNCTKIQGQEIKKKLFPIDNTPIKMETRSASTENVLEPDSDIFMAETNSTLQSTSTNLAEYNGLCPRILSTQKKEIKDEKFGDEGVEEFQVQTEMRVCDYCWLWGFDCEGSVSVCCECLGKHVTCSGRYKRKFLVCFGLMDFIYLFGI